MRQTQSVSNTAQLAATTVRQLIESVARTAWAPADRVRLRELVEYVELAERRCAAGNHGSADRVVRDAEFRRALLCAAAIGARYC